MGKFIFSLIIFFCSAITIYASVQGLVGDAIKPSGAITTSPIDIVLNIIAYAIGLASVLGVIGITWGGITMILSVGEDEKQKKGKNILVYSLIGVVVAGLAYSIVTIVGNLTLN